MPSPTPKASYVPFVAKAYLVQATSTALINGKGKVFKIPVPRHITATANGVTQEIANTKAIIKCNQKAFVVLFDQMALFTAKQVASAKSAQGYPYTPTYSNYIKSAIET